MKLLRPMILKEKYHLYIQRELDRILDEVIYKPLAKVLKEDSTFNLQINNAINDPLFIAVKDGRVWYEDGQFKGNFNARISKSLIEKGATYNKAAGTYSLAFVPMEISMAVALAQSGYQKLRQEVLHTLDMMDIESINMISDLPNKYHQTIGWMEDDFQKTAKAIGIEVNLTEEQKGILTADYSFDMDRYIKNWSQEEILRLRGVIQDQLFSGKRQEIIAREIQRSFNLSRNKAKFLARQESGLLMSQYSKMRYTDIGSNKYIWRGSMDERERHDHKLLEGTIHTWDNPPITNLKTGAKNHPSQDFGCRCIAVPIID